jgi:hypothetical protein
MVPSHVVSIAFFGLLQENLSLLMMEIVTYLCMFILMLHVQSSGKRNATMLVASVVQLLFMELILMHEKRWHAQALVRYFFCPKLSLSIHIISVVYSCLDLDGPRATPSLRDSAPSTTLLHVRDYKTLLSLD